MATEFARVELAVNSMLGKPIALLVYGMFLTSRWTIKHAAKLAVRLQRWWFAKSGIAPRR